MPTSTDVPAVDCEVMDLAPSPLNPLGVKGAGEIGIVATGACLSNAVSNALSSLGVEGGVQVYRMPLSPDRIRDLIRSASEQAPSWVGPLDTEEGTMADKDIRCAIGVDLDAVAGWLGSYGGEDSPDDISRGLFAGEVGTPRLLKLFRKVRAHHHMVHPGALHRDVPSLRCR